VGDDRTSSRSRAGPWLAMSQPFGLGCSGFARIFVCPVRGHYGLMAKLTKEEASYTPKSDGDRCGECKWFEIVRANGCEIVDGEIASRAWCKFHHDAAHRRGSRLARSQDRQRKEVARMRGGPE
jgi:hypothetical protein